MHSDCDRHVDGCRHEGVGGREEEGDEDGEDLVVVGLAPSWKREEKEGADEEEDVVDGQGAEDDDEVPSQLDVLVVEHADGDDVADDAEEADDGHEESLYGHFECKHLGVSEIMTCLLDFFQILRTRIPNE